MAKQKKPLSPEQAEIKAMKKEKSSNGWTKFWAIVLALVLVAGTFVVGQSTAKKALEAAGTNVGSNATTETPSTDNSGDDDLLLDGDATTPDADATTPDADATTPNGDATTPGADAPAGDKNDGAATTQFSKANAHEMFNKWTAAAAKGSYKFARVCAYTPDGAIDVGGATDTLNRVIKMVDKNASLDSVVGGFLGIGNRDGEVKNGQIPEGMNKQYALKAMQLTAADIKAAANTGNKYQVQLNACSNPQKDNSNALSRATNDFFTHQEVVDGISALTTLITVSSTDVQYSSILLTAVVDGDTLKSLEISYTFAAQMNLKAGISIEGKGKATNKITYTMA
jgi:hypothetical protein